MAAPKCKHCSSDLFRGENNKWVCLSCGKSHVVRRRASKKTKKLTDYDLAFLKSVNIRWN